MSDALPAFDYQRLDAFKVAREALRLGDALARRLPRGYATLQDQLRRALLSAYLGIAEASSRQGADRAASAAPAARPARRRPWRACSYSISLPRLRS